MMVEARDKKFAAKRRKKYLSVDGRVVAPIGARRMIENEEDLFVHFCG